MAQRMTAAQQRGKATYLARVAKAAPFTQRRFPSYGKATASDKRAARQIVDNIYGSERKKVDFKPILGPHTSIVHLVRTKAEAKRAAALGRAQVQALNLAFAKKLADFRAWAAKEKAAGRRVDAAPPQAPTMQHHIQRVKSAEDITRIKRDIGQGTPGSIRAIFIKQEKLPSQDGVFSDGDILRLSDGKWVVLNGWQVVIFRPIDPVRYAMDPEHEEARVMARLRRDFVAVAARFKKTRDWDFTEDNATFTLQTGRHQFYGGTGTHNLSDETGVHWQLAQWRARYGHAEAVQAARGGMRQHQAPVTEWLTGINLVLFLGRAGARQHLMAWEAQYRTRIRKKRAARFMRTPKQKPLQKRKPRKGTGRR